MPIFKLDSKIYGAWSVEKEDDVYTSYNWNESSDSLCHKKTQQSLQVDENPDHGSASQVSKKSTFNKPDLPE